MDLNEMIVHGINVTFWLYRYESDHLLTEPTNFLRIAMMSDHRTIVTIEAVVNPHQFKEENKKFQKGRISKFTFNA